MGLETPPPVGLKEWICKGICLGSVDWEVGNWGKWGRNGEKGIWVGNS